MPTSKEILFYNIRRSKTILKFIPKPIKDALTSRLMRHKRCRVPYEPSYYPRGINLFGFLSASLGLGQGARLYASALESSNLPYALIDVRLSQEISYGNKEFEGSLANAPVYRVNVVHLNPDVLPIYYALTPGSYWDRRYNIGVWLWELEQIPPAWYDYLAEYDELWAPSSFIADALRNVAKIPVHVIPYGIQAPVEPNVTRQFFGLPESGFLVLCMFDLHSYTSRKNPSAAVSAFFKAFGKHHEKAKLILKVHNASPKDMAGLRQLIKDSENVIIIN